MILSTLLIVMALSAEKSGGTICKRETFQLDLGTQGPTKSRNPAKLIKLQAEKTQVNEKAKILFLAVKRRFQYCLPKLEREESPLCRTNDEPITYSKEEMEKALRAQKCLVGDTCREYECKGSSQTATCLDPKLTKYVDQQQVPSLNKASSAFYGTCIQYWGCQKRTVEANIHLMENMDIRVADPLMGMFTFQKGNSYAKGEEDGAYARIVDGISITKDVCELTCIKNSGSHICYNQEDKTVFSVGKNGKTCVGHSCFKIQSTKLQEEEEIADLGEVPTQYDLTRLYRLVQFQSLQTIWDIEQMQSRTTRIESILGRLISALLETEQKGLIIKSIAGVTPGPVKGSPPNLEIGVCRDNFTLESSIREKAWEPITGIWVHGNETQRSTVKLFLNPLLSLEEVPKPSFEVDKLTYHDISKMSMSMNGRNNEPLQENDGGSFWGDNIYWLLFTRIGALLGWLFLVRLVIQNRSGSA